MASVRYERGHVRKSEGMGIRRTRILGVVSRGE